MFYKNNTIFYSLAKFLKCEMAVLDSLFTWVKWETGVDMNVLHILLYDVLSEISFSEGRTLPLTFTDGCQASFQGETLRLRKAKHFLTKPLHWGIQLGEQLQKQEPYLQMHRTQSRKELASNPWMILGELSTTSNSTTNTEARISCLGTLLPMIFLKTCRCLCSTIERTK